MRRFTFNTIDEANKFIDQLKSLRLTGSFDFNSRPYSVTVDEPERLPQNMLNVEREVKREFTNVASEVAPIEKGAYGRVKEFVDKFDRERTHTGLEPMYARSQEIRAYRGTGNGLEPEAIFFTPHGDIGSREWFDITSNIKYPTYRKELDELKVDLLDANGYEPAAMLYQDENTKDVFTLILTKPGTSNYYAYIIDLPDNSFNDIQIFGKDLSEMIAQGRNAMTMYLHGSSGNAPTPPPKPSLIPSNDGWVMRNSNSWYKELETGITANILLADGYYSVDIIDMRPEFYGKRYMGSAKYYSLEEAKEGAISYYNELEEKLKKKANLKPKPPKQRESELQRFQF